ncbi:hypothetical protein BGX26_010704 [Mortierella sp. AD094]|nr:hypothetical protein BGX26_010704 [Mortierella sp. AD094]
MFGCQAAIILHLFSSSQKAVESEDETTPYTTLRLLSTGKTITLKPSAAKAKLVPASPERNNLRKKTNNAQFNLASIDTPVTSPSCEQGAFDLMTPSWTPIAGSIYEKDEDAVELTTPGILNYNVRALNHATDMPLTPQTLASRKTDEADSMEDIKTFKWTQGGRVVVVTGTFDNWEKSITLSRSHENKDNFEASVNVPRTQKILFKFVVDGQWMCSDSYATECDEQGNLNNVLPATQQTIV